MKIRIVNNTGSDVLPLIRKTVLNHVKAGEELRADILDMFTVNVTIQDDVTIAVINWA